MKVKALRRFRYSADGVNNVTKQPGEVFDCREDLVEGLVASEYVEAAPETKAMIQNPGGGQSNSPAGALEDLDKAQLKKLAEERFGLKLDGRMAEPAMIEAIREAEAKAAT